MTTKKRFFTTRPRWARTRCGARVPATRRPATSPRRLFLATVAGALVAETAGRVAERTMVSETARLRLEQRRREIAKGLAKFGFVVVDDRPRQIVSGAEAELSRAGTISGLALVGAMGSRGIAKAKSVAAAARRKREETAMKTRHSATTDANVDAPPTAAEKRRARATSPRRCFFDACHARCGNRTGSRLELVRLDQIHTSGNESCRCI